MSSETQFTIAQVCDEIKEVETMKKVLLPIVVFIGVFSALAGITLIRLSKSMEDWEASWEEEDEDEF